MVDTPKAEGAATRRQATDERPMDIIQMTKDGKEYADTTVEAFNEVWEPKGWKRADPKLVASKSASASSETTEGEDI